MSTAITFENDRNTFTFNGQSAFNPQKVFSRANRLRAQKAGGDGKLEVPMPLNNEKTMKLDAIGIGALIGFCLNNGINWVQFRDCSVSVNYLDKMLRFRAKNRWFLDYLFNCGDHQFDANTPTPGANWGEGRRLLKEARRLSKSGEAGAADQSASLKEQARVLLFEQH